jgi:hypothetical protein
MHNYFTLGIILILIGIALAMLVHSGLGILVILVGLAFVIVPALANAGR